MHDHFGFGLWPKGLLIEAFFEDRGHVFIGEGVDLEGPETCGL
jgi:hypothetical protein